MEIFDILKKPILSEKTTSLHAELNKYTFMVYTTTNKIEIRRAVEKLFSVKVLSVETTMVRGKKRRVRYRKYGKTNDWKKAIVTLKKGDSIKVFEGA